MPSPNPVEIRSNLGGVLTDLKNADAALKRNLRRSIRRSGDAILNEAGRILDTENPGLVVGKVSVGRRIRRLDAAGSTGRSRRNMRQAVKRGMTTRVTNGQRGATFRVISAAETSELPAKALNKRELRHPVFGDRRTWVAQTGLQYFKRGIEVGAKQAREDLNAAIADAISQMRANPPVK